MPRIKDNSKINQDIIARIPGISKKVTNKTFEKLIDAGIFVFPELKDTEDLLKDQFVLNNINGEYFSGNVMGFIGCGSERLTIGSRFSKGEQDFFFHYMLSKVMNLPNIMSMKTDAELNENMFDIFIFMFPFYLKKALRKGVFKTYIRREYNDSNVKGTINISRHIRSNTPFIGNVAYDQREYSYDNYLTELIRHTIEFIKQKKYGSIILNNVKDEIKEVIRATEHYQPVDRHKIVYLNKKHIIRHAFYKEYYDLQNLCLLILQNRKGYIGSGSGKMYGILFDGAWLWEEYIAILIKENYYHPMNRRGKEAQSLFFKREGKIYPDFISKNAADRIIADAKYKPFDNIANRDYLQVLAYMFRFDSKKGIYIYPEAGNEEDKVYYLNSGLTYEKNIAKREDICLIKCGLKIPQDAGSYEEFVKAIRKSEKEFLVKL